MQGRVAMEQKRRKKIIWGLVFLASSTVLLGVPALMLATWSWQINEARQWGELLRVGLMIFLPVLPLVFWYSRQ